MPRTTLSLYYRAIDEGRIPDALAMLDPDVRFVMVLPAGARRGHGRADMEVVLRESRDDDLEVLYGKVSEGGSPTGRFLSGVRLGADGLIASYEVTFDTEHVLVEG